MTRYSFSESKLFIFPRCVVEITEIYSHFFGKNFVKVTFVLKKLLSRWFDEIIFVESNFFILPHSHCGKIKNLLSPKYFPSNHLFGKCFAFTKFLQKSVRVNIHNFNTVTLFRFSILLYENFVKSTFLLQLLESISRNIFQWE